MNKQSSKRDRMLRIIGRTGPLPASQIAAQGFNDKEVYNLLRAGFVCRDDSTPARFSLTPAGKARADGLPRAEWPFRAPRPAQGRQSKPKMQGRRLTPQAPPSMRTMFAAAATAAKAEAEALEARAQRLRKLAEELERSDF